MMQANTTCITMIPFNDNILSPFIHYVIFSFPCGPAGGPKGLTPQHLKDMIQPPAGEGGSALISSLTSFANMVLYIIEWGGFGRRFTFCLCCKLNCITKERREGVGLIAVGNILCRLVAKCVGSAVNEEMNSANLKGWKLGVSWGYARRRSLGSITVLP